MSLIFRKVDGNWLYVRTEGPAVEVRFATRGLAGPNTFSCCAVCNAGTTRKVDELFARFARAYSR